MFLVDLYEQGKDVGEDDALAMVWHLKAANMGMAKDWYQRATDQESCHGQLAQAEKLLFRNR